MDSFIRIASLSHKLHLGNPRQTVEEMISLMNEAGKYDPDVYLFPADSFTGSQLGTLAFQASVANACENCVKELLKYSKKLRAYLIIGSMLFRDGKPQSVTYVLREGEIKEVLFPESWDYVFAVGNVRFHVLPTSASQLVSSGFIDQTAQLGTDITLIPSSSPAAAGNAKKDLEIFRRFSEETESGVVLASGCVGDTSFPYVKRAAVAVLECGRVLSSKHSLEHGVFTVVDLDADIIRSQKVKDNLPVYAENCYDLLVSQSRDSLLRIVEKDPYLPKEPEAQKDYLLDLFQLQAASLAARLEHIHCDKVVVGVSGGLDSTLALLVCHRAFTMRNLPKNQIIAVTMQGFGTSGNTYQNALTLMEQLGCTILEVPIRDAVLQHFKDIGHDPMVMDVTYENAQARERTQILLDIANQHNAIVVGTGDLSEEALGFATFAGDHMANFNVNTCVTKSMIRKLVSLLSETAYFKGCREVLGAILDTPISPELLPPDESGQISQKTETILGPYELHDFFLYYFMKYHFAPSKIYLYAKKAFADSFDGAYIKEKLAIFFKRFCSSQFKRSCTPDSAVISEINLSNSVFSMPSDFSAELFLQEIESLQ